MAWSPLQGGLLSDKFLRGQARAAESRLNTLDAPGNVDDDRLNGPWTCWPKLRDSAAYRYRRSR